MLYVSCRGVSIESSKMKRTPNEFVGSKNCGGVPDVCCQIFPVHIVKKLIIIGKCLHVDLVLNKKTFQFHRLSSPFNTAIDICMPYGKLLSYSLRKLDKDRQRIS